MAQNTPMATAPFNLTDVDRATLLLTDEEFLPDTWTDLKDAIASKDLSTLQRKPSILRRYIAWSQETISKFGSTAAFIIQERLRWDLPLHTKNPVPFADPTDFKVLYNDWPYGLTSDIAHLVIWLKMPLVINADGELLTEFRAQVDNYVEQTYVERMRQERGEEDRVVWFKNVPKLQSVGALEHFHVLVRGASSELLQEWTEGDVPMYLK